jgi:hypothetical protein
MMKNVRKYAAEQGVAKKQALRMGMEKVSRELAEKGSDFTRRR